jgi:hypothetical protein
MPNHITNDVRILGPAADLADIKARAQHDDFEFDFGAFIPFPDELIGIHSGGVNIDGVQHQIWRIQEEIDGEREHGFWGAGGTPVAVPEEEQEALIRDFGATNSYDWCIQSWGTKWNAYNVNWEVSDYVIVKFDTAWSPPRPVFQAIANQYPKVFIENRWVDEGWEDHYITDHYRKEEDYEHIHSAL